eukprot:CAMPEP_0197020868 /NCGR_PEP_ID=MMETSP1384-20130603/1733_1 /TAXON_ID=29189 /ORGANISM="Ammonia sp." /LENGTH=50 /DNA_ID=CAMNT_0042448579 /DNA_START=157 /DNA_END=309 /DNA_ORIENTATION=+
MKSSFFGLPIGAGTWIAVYTPATLYVICFTKKFEKGDPLEYERNVRGRDV